MRSSLFTFVAPLALTLGACATNTTMDSAAELSDAASTDLRPHAQRDSVRTSRTDETVLRDQAELEALSAELVAGLGLDRDAITVSYVGKGDLLDMDDNPEDIEDGSGLKDEGRSDTIQALRAFHPETQNEFRLVLTDKALAAVAELAAREDLASGSGDRETLDPEGDESAAVEGALVEAERSGEAPPSWSTNVDNRVRLSKTAAESPGTTGTTTWPWRAISRLSNGCTGTLIGPRHVVTAGHCIYSRTNSAWLTFNVSPGQAGSSLFPYGSVGFPSAGFNWYFTPEEWRESSPSGGSRQYDFGILVLPQRIGESTGWMGWWVEEGSKMAKESNLNRGYPACNATDAAGNPRTDDPGDPGSSVTCVSQHLYGDSNNCSLGEFQKEDPDGWNRIFMHSCDASGGHSGSPIYHYEGSTPVVSGVHTFSTCGQIASSPDCLAGDIRPLGATRITPEYSDWISFFRVWAP